MLSKLANITETCQIYQSIKKQFGVGKLNPDQDMEGFRKLLLDGMNYGK